MQCITVSTARNLVTVHLAHCRTSVERCYSLVTIGTTVIDDSLKGVSQVLSLRYSEGCDILPYSGPSDVGRLGTVKCVSWTR